ncbi:hypothetical protein Sjap_012580 [Stephania japonica]|uniref:Protein downstream neighbor of Son n=1 Tax=Stephania japonica TaxID=461633 RepID=A0AAP0NXS2_9MAGN
MAKAAVAGSLPSSSLPFESGTRAGSAMKRKTPSELREEQLKRSSTTVPTDESTSSLLNSEKITGAYRRFKKPETSKVPRYIETRVDGVYPVKKCSNMFRMAPGKEKVQDKLPYEPSITLKNPSLASNVDCENQSRLLCADGPAVSATSSKDGTSQSCKTTDKHSENKFLSVAELSLGRERSSGQLAIDLEVLKKLGARETPAAAHSPVVSSEKIGDFSPAYSENFSIDLDASSSLTPIDLTLKTSMRLISSSSVKWGTKHSNQRSCRIASLPKLDVDLAIFQFDTSIQEVKVLWCHRLTRSNDYGGNVYPLGIPLNPEASSSLAPKSRAEALFSRSLHSWVYPQACLPPSVISALNLSAPQGETDFLLKRQLAWEDSFRSLYYMLRKNICDIFYVCTSKFVVMFAGGVQLRKERRICHAYISQSTRGLRSLLREHDICFSMPLCHSVAEQATAEDLVELSEIEKRSLGHARRLDSKSEIDNIPQSLLAFSENENVHGLYDFLLNYRSFLTSLIGADVPVLHSPMPFENASLSVPEVKCKEMKRSDAVQVPSRGPNAEECESNGHPLAGLYYSIEIKDTVLPPWIIYGICAAMCSEKKSFEARFTTEPNSVGLNAALDMVSQKQDAQLEPSKDNSYTFGIPGCVVSPCLRSASLTGLKYSNNSYTASASTV